MLAEDLTTAIDRFTIQVRQRGQVTIPSQVRDALSIKEGDTLSLVQIGDTLLVTPKRLRGPELGERFVALMEEKGVTLADLLQDLPTIREEIFSERYGARTT
jgi:AbrB family looped-hinge helix DNA binding protein